MPIYKSTLNTNNKPKKPKDEKPKKEKKPVSKETRKKRTSLIVLLVSLLSFVFSIAPTPLKAFYLGVFGIFAYPLFLSLALISTAGLSNKKYLVNKRYIVCLSFCLFFVVLLTHLILTHNIPIEKYSKFLTDTYKAQTTGAGIIFSLISYPICKYLTVVGAYVITIIGMVISGGLTIDCIIVARNTPQKVESKFNFNELKTLNENTNDVTITMQHKQEDLKKKIAKQKLGLEKNESKIISSSMPIENIVEKLPKNKPISKRDYILTPPEIVMPDYSNEKESSSYSSYTTSSFPKNTVSNNFASNNHYNKPQNNKDDVIVTDADDFYDDAKVIEGKSHIEEKTEIVNNLYINENPINIDKDINFNTIDFNNIPSDKEDLLPSEPTVVSTNATFKSNLNINSLALNQTSNEFNEEFEEDLEETIEDNIQTVQQPYTQPQKQEIPLASDIDSQEIRPLPKFDNQNKTLTKSLEKEEEPTLGRPKKHYAPYVKPPVDLLNYAENVEVVTDEECAENIDKLEKVLEDFKIPAKVKAVQVGPAVTRYEIGMPTGVSVKKVQMHADDIAMVLASNGGIRIEAPIPGKNAVGIEVPNKVVASVSLREMIESEDYQKRVNPMSFVLGKDINGTIQFCNLDKMPHLLVAGSTGSGKSVCLNTMLISMIYKSSPEDVRLILIDPKTVEFSVYANLPHLLTPHIITTKEQAINSLNWAIKEMEYRYKLLQRNEVVNIKEYNNLPIVKNGEVQKLPYIVTVIDELNDLMIDTKREMEERIMKLAQKSRAAGIHLVIATQRPSVDVITGTIKANLPSRIAFALTNFADSKTVLDMGGAEKLLGRGDSLFKPNDMPEPRRIQGAYISSAEVSAVVKFIKANNSTDFDDSTTEAITAENQETTSNKNSGNNNKDSFDPITKDALKWFISAGQASITMIQRRFGVGYARAARIIDQMEQNGFISGQDGAKPRQVLISMEEYNQIFG